MTKWWYLLCHCFLWAFQSILFHPPFAAVATCLSQHATMTFSITTTTTDAVRGVWRREFEEDPLGDEDSADRTTLVLWTQAPQSGLYIDLRLPQGSLGRGDRDSSTPIRKNPRALQGRGILVPPEDLSDDDRALLLSQKSFAGTLHFSLGDTTDSNEALAKDAILAHLAHQDSSDDPPVAGGTALPLCTCFWERNIDFRPPTGGLDIGVCASGPPNSDGSIDMRETGEDASYAEGWHRLPGSDQGPFLACQLMNENGVDRQGFWVRTGPFFAYAIGRPHDEESARKLQCSPQSPHIQASVGKTLDEALEEAGWGLDAVGSYVSVWGVVTPATEEDRGTASWKILHSTDPSLVGCELLGPGTFSCSTLSLEKGTSTELSNGSILTQTVGSDDCLRSWKVMEITDVSIMKEELLLGQA